MNETETSNPVGVTTWWVADCGAWHLSNGNLTLHCPDGVVIEWSNEDADG